MGGKYVVERLLAQGGMGEVYLAQHEVLGEPVAIKVLLAQYLHHDEALSRFLNEAKAAAKIKSEHVARVTDVAVSERGMPYIVMEYLEGEDLEHLVQTGGPLVPADAVDMVLQSLDAIAQAHALGMVHRDLKPSNLFRARLPDGSHIVKVLDFGISKAPTASAKLTGTSSMLGSPMYTAPEQLRNARNATARSDVWSLGVILFELMSARLPYEGETLGELIVSMMERPPTPLGDVAPNVPVGLQEVVMQCLRRVEEERFDGVRELALALEPYALQEGRGMGVARRLSTAQPQFAQAVASIPSNDLVRPTMTEWSRSHGTPHLPTKRTPTSWKWGGGAAASVFALMGMFLAVRSNSSSSQKQHVAGFGNTEQGLVPAVLPLAAVVPELVASPSVVAPPSIAASSVHDAGLPRHVVPQTISGRGEVPHRQVLLPVAHDLPVPQKSKSALPPGTSSRK